MVKPINRDDDDYEYIELSADEELPEGFEIVEDDGESQNDSIEMHDILMVKTRIERTMTELLKKGYDFNDVLKEINVKDEKTYNQCLNLCNSINTIEKNMKALITKDK